MESSVLSKRGLGELIKLTSLSNVYLVKDNVVFEKIIKGLLEKL